MSALGVILLAVGSGSRTVSVVSGVLVLAFCTSAITGYILGSIFLQRGAVLARVQNDFLSSVSHELRTPLTSMRMFFETVNDDRVTDPAERARCMQLLQREMQRLDGLVTRLIDLSRIESGRHAFKRELVKVADIVEDSQIGLEAAALGDDVDFKTDVEDGLEVLGDREALVQAVVNLLVNAYKYSGDEPRIELSARSHGKQVELSVADNGPGVSRAEQRQIFEKFERGTAAIEGGRTGSGLGLSIVRAIVDAHKGSISLKSDSRSGACFSILLPRAV
jgi:two-component system phosphate regulon sensor histidine kinase PhoR